LAIRRPVAKSGDGFGTLSTNPHRPQRMYRLRSVRVATAVSGELHARQGNSFNRSLRRSNSSGLLFELGSSATEGDATTSVMVAPSGNRDAASGESRIAAASQQLVRSCSLSVRRHMRTPICGSRRLWHGPGSIAGRTSEEQVVPGACFYPHECAAAVGAQRKLDPICAPVR
jgi:hypothetical protein